MLKLLFGFQGRISLGQYWSACLLAFGALFVSVMLLGPSLPGALGKPAASDTSLLSSLLSLVMSLASTWLSLAAQVKRFHDRGRTGLWVLAPVVPAVMIGATMISALVTQGSIDQAVSSSGIWFLILCALSGWFFVELGCLGSKPGLNKYGDPPGAPRPAAPTTAPRAARPAPAPSIPGVSMAPPAAPAAGISFSSAEQALARALAERARSVSAPAPSTAPRASGPSFGRKATTAG